MKVTGLFHIQTDSQDDCLLQYLPHFLTNCISRVNRPSQQSKIGSHSDKIQTILFSEVDMGNFFIMACGQ